MRDRGVLRSGRGAKKALLDQMSEKGKREGLLTQGSTRPSVGQGGRRVPQVESDGRGWPQRNGRVGRPSVRGGVRGEEKEDESCEAKGVCRRRPRNGDVDEEASVTPEAAECRGCGRLQGDAGVRLSLSACLLSPCQLWTMNAGPQLDRRVAQCWPSSHGCLFGGCGSRGNRQVELRPLTKLARWRLGRGV